MKKRDIVKSSEEFNKILNNYHIATYYLKIL